MYGCDNWIIKKLRKDKSIILNCGVGEDSWKSHGLPADQSSQSNENKSWIFVGRADVDVETPILWPPDANNWLTGRNPDAGKDWRQEVKGMTEDEMVRWHHQLNRHEFEQASGAVDGQGSLVCYSPCGCKESYRTELLNWLSQWCHPIISSCLHLLLLP